MSIECSVTYCFRYNAIVLVIEHLIIHWLLEIGYWSFICHGLLTSFGHPVTWVLSQRVSLLQ
jgi:hypothetical protein